MCTASLFASFFFRGLNINCCCNVMRKTRGIEGFSLEDFPEQYSLKRRIRDEKSLAIHHFAGGSSVALLA